MNTNTGEILRLKQVLADLKEIPAGFKFVPDELAEEAEDVLQGLDSAVADLTKDTPLTRWAKHDRNKNRRKMQKASKRRNRA